MTSTWALRNPVKALADFLTLFRLFVAFAIVTLGFSVGEAGLGVAVRLTLLGWITDILDGRLARRSGVRNWVSRMDFSIDMILLYAMFIYLVVSGFVSVQFAVWYTVVALVSILLLRKQAVTKLFAAPLYLLQILIAYSKARRLAYAYLIYIGMALIVNWERFKQEANAFLRDMREVAKVRV